MNKQLTWLTPFSMKIDNHRIITVNHLFRMKEDNEENEEN